MSSLNDLKDKISEDNDKVLFEEVLICVESEAFRSAYIMNWICIAESIKNKFQMMQIRDPRIKDICEKLKKSEDTGHPIDHKLIDDAKNLGIITPDEFKKLNLIREMRNSYAHPSGNAPKKEEVMWAITTGIELVLSKPPLFRHGFVKTHLDRIFEDKHYLIDSKPEIMGHAKDFKALIHPEVLEFALGMSLKAFEKSIDDYNLRIIENRASIYSCFILKDILEKNILINNNDSLNHFLDEYPISCSLLYIDSHIWSTYLNPQLKNRVYGYLNDYLDKKGNMSHKIFKSLFKLYNQNLLSNNQIRKFNDKTDELGYTFLINSAIPLDYYYERIINDLKSYTFDIQNTAAEALRRLGPDQVNTIDNHSQEQLGRNILQAADGGSFEAINLIHELKEQIWPAKFIEGVLLETMINDNGYFRFKGSMLTTVLSSVILHPDHKKIFEKLSLEISTSQPVNSSSVSSYEKTLDKIDKVEKHFETQYGIITPHLTNLRIQIENIMHDSVSSPIKLKST